MYFNNPEALWLLAIALPLGALFTLMAFWRRRQLHRTWADEQLLGAQSSPLRPWLYAVRTAFVCAGLTLVVVALARPSEEKGRSEFPQGTTDLVVLTDVSRSMAALDYKGKIPSDSPFKNGTRLDMARYLMMKEVIPALGANRFGLVTYAGAAYPLAPLTLDVPAVDWVSQRAMGISSAPGNGSALVQAFYMAMALFELDSDKDHRKIIVVFSDGGNDDGLDQLTNVCRELQKRGIELVVVGVGRPVPSAIPISELSPTDRSQFYGKEFYEVNGEVVTSQLDENALRILANRSGGRYVRVNNASDFNFDMLSQRLELKWRPGRKELFFYPLLLGLVLLTAGWFSTSRPGGASLAYIVGGKWLRRSHNNQT